MSYSAVGPVLTRNTTKRLGIRIAPHDARDAAATMWAIVAPEQIGVARDLLAHGISDDHNTTIAREVSRPVGRIARSLRGCGEGPRRGDP